MNGEGYAGEWEFLLRSAEMDRGEERREAELERRAASEFEPSRIVTRMRVVRTKTRHLSDHVFREAIAGRRRAVEAAIDHCSECALCWVRMGAQVARLGKSGREAA
jgi:hypothetical protein